MWGGMVGFLEEVPPTLGSEIKKNKLQAVAGGRRQGLTETLVTSVLLSSHLLSYLISICLPLHS